MSWYVYFLTADTFLIWYLRYFYLSAVTALCGAVGLQVSLLGLGIFRKKLGVGVGNAREPSVPLTKRTATVFL